MADRSGVITSAADLEAAIEWAGENPKSRWYVARLARAYGRADLIPEDWGTEDVKSFREQRITSEEDMQRSANIDAAVTAFNDAVAEHQRGDIDQEEAATLVASATSWAYQAGVLDAAFTKMQIAAVRAVESGEVDQDTMDALLAAGEKVVRKVRTPAGEKRYGAPIGTPIVRNTKTGKLEADKSAVPSEAVETKSAQGKTEAGHPTPGDAVAKGTKNVNTSAKDLQEGDEILARDGRSHVVEKIERDGDSVRLTVTDANGQQTTYSVPGTTRVRAVKDEAERPTGDPAKVSERLKDDVEDTNREIKRLKDAAATTKNPNDARRATDEARRLAGQKSEALADRDKASRITPKPVKGPPPAPDREITRGRSNYAVTYKNRAGQDVQGQFWSLADGGRDAFVIPDGERRPIRVTVTPSGSIEETPDVNTPGGGRKLSDNALMDALIPRRDDDAQMDMFGDEQTPDAPTADSPEGDAPSPQTPEPEPSPQAAGFAEAREGVKSAQTAYTQAFHDAERLSARGQGNTPEGVTAREKAAKAERKLAEAEAQLAALERPHIGEQAYEARMRVASSKIRRLDGTLADLKREKTKANQVAEGNRLQEANQTARREFAEATATTKALQESNADPVAILRARVAQLEAKGRVGRTVADFQQWQYETHAITATQYDEKRAAWSRANATFQEALESVRQELATAEDAERGWQDPDIDVTPEAAPETVDAPESPDAPEAPETPGSGAPESETTPEVSEADRVRADSRAKSEAAYAERVAAAEKEYGPDSVEALRAQFEELSSKLAYLESDLPAQDDNAIADVKARQADLRVKIAERTDPTPEGESDSPGAAKGESDSPEAAKGDSDADLWESASGAISKDARDKVEALNAEAARIREGLSDDDNSVDGLNARLQAHVLESGARVDTAAEYGRRHLTGDLSKEEWDSIRDASQAQQRADMLERRTLVAQIRELGGEPKIQEADKWYESRTKAAEKVEEPEAEPKAAEPKAEPKPEPKPDEKSGPRTAGDLRERDIVRLNGKLWRVGQVFNNRVSLSTRTNGKLERANANFDDLEFVMSAAEEKQRGRAKAAEKYRADNNLEDRGTGPVTDVEYRQLTGATKALRQKWFNDPDAFSSDRLDDIEVEMNVRLSELGDAMWEVSERKKIYRVLSDINLARREREQVSKRKDAEEKAQGSTSVDADGKPLKIFGQGDTGRRVLRMGEVYTDSKGKRKVAEGGEEIYTLTEQDMIYRLGKSGYQQWAILRQLPNGDVEILSSRDHSDRPEKVGDVRRIVHPSQLSEGTSRGSFKGESANERRARRGEVLRDISRKELDTEKTYEITDGPSAGKTGRISNIHGDDLDRVRVEFDDGTTGHFPASMLRQSGTRARTKSETPAASKKSETAGPSIKPRGDAETDEVDALFREDDPEETGGELIDGSLVVRDRQKALSTLDEAIEAAESNLDPKVTRGRISAEDKKLYGDRVKALKAVRARVADDSAGTQSANSEAEKKSDVPTVEDLERLEAEYHRVYNDPTASDHLKLKARMDYMRAARARAKATGEPFRALEPASAPPTVKPGQVIYNSGQRPTPYTAGREGRRNRLAERSAEELAATRAQIEAATKKPEEPKRSEPAKGDAPEPEKKSTPETPAADRPQGRGAAGAADEYQPDPIENTGDVVLHHGGLPAGTTMDDIDVNRRGSQQGKRRRSFGGFYLTDDSSLSWSETYAAGRGGTMHAFKISPDARIGEISDLGGKSNIDRISEEQREHMAKSFDVIKGKDLLGRTQYLLLNKSVVEEVRETNINDRDSAPVITRPGEKAASKVSEAEKAERDQAARKKAIETQESIQRGIAAQFSAPRPERKRKTDADKQTKADAAADSSKAEYELDKALEGRKDAAGNPVINGARYRLGRGYQEWRVASVNRDGSLNLEPASGTSPLGTARNRKNVASNRLLPVTEATPTNAAPIAATRSAATTADNKSLTDLKDASGNALYTEGRYNLGRGYQRWKVDSVNPDGTVNLVPTGGGDVTRKRWNVDPKKLKPVDGGEASAPETPSVTQQDRRARITAAEKSAPKAAEPVATKATPEPPATDTDTTAVTPPKGMSARVYRILIRTEENRVQELQDKVHAGTATNGDREELEQVEKNLAKLRGEEAQYFPNASKPQEPTPEPAPAPKAKRITRNTEEWADLDDDTLDELVRALDEEGDDANSALGATDAANLRNERAFRDQQNSDLDRINQLIADGYDPAEAESEVTGQSVEAIRRRDGLQWLRDTYGGVPAVSGNRFEEVLASAYRFELTQELERAEAATNGQLLRKGSRGKDASILWKGNERTARANASEELKAYWDEHGRLTKDEFRDRVMEAIGRRGASSRYTGADFHQ